MHAGVRQEVADGLPQRAVVADDPDRVGRDDHGPRRLDGPEIPGGVLDHRREVDRPGVGGAALVESGEAEEVVHERAHPGRLLLDAAHRALQVLGGGEAAGAVQLGIPADRREGGAQLVGGVGDEAVQPRLRGRAVGEGALDAAEHRVQGQAQTPRLGALVDLGDALVERAGGDRAGGGGHRRERPHPLPQHPPGDRGQRREDGRGRGDQAPTMRR